ncbi:MAG: ANTAR domain-containing protein [Candidatus Thiodiazotropha sp.]
MSPKKLLLVSDTNLDKLNNMLAWADVEIKRVNSKELALEEINNFKPDLVLLDSSYYGSNGSHLTHRLFDLEILFVYICHQEIEKISNSLDSKPENILELLPDIDSALKWISNIRRLKETEARYSKAIQTGRVVDVVIGILMERYNLNRDSAFELLRQKARSERMQLRVLAQEILDAQQKINMISPK